MSTPLPDPELPPTTSLVDQIRTDLSSWCSTKGLTYFEAADAFSAWVAACQASDGALVVAWLGFERQSQSRSALVVSHQLSLTIARGASLGQDRAAFRDSGAGAIPDLVSDLAVEAMSWIIEPLHLVPEIQSCRPVLDRDGIPLDAYDLRISILAPIPGAAPEKILSPSR